MTETQGLHVWLADKDGYFAGELDAPTATEDLATFAASAAKNGHTVIDKGSDPAATRPPDRPLSAADQARVDKAAQLAALRAKGWANLTASEQTTARALAFDLGQYAPG